jgi:hypothetical protein
MMKKLMTTICQAISKMAIWTKLSKKLVKPISPEIELSIGCPAGNAHLSETSRLKELRLAHRSAARLDAEAGEGVVDDLGEIVEIADDEGRSQHPEFKERTIWEVFQDERASLMELRGPFDGFVEKAVRATTTCLIMADHNRYSVDARAAGRMVLVRSHAERIVVLYNDAVVAEHPRHFRRDQVIYDPWHYLPVLMRKPGALRNGAPFKDWDLPVALAQVARS